MNIEVTPLVKNNDPGQVGLVSITEGRYENGEWVPGRRLNGDEFHIKLGQRPSMVRVRLVRRDR